MALCGKEKASIKVKLSKLHCPFTWDLLDNVIKYTTYNKNNENNTVDDEASCNLELLMVYLLKCYKSILSADNNVKKTIDKAEKILMKLQQGQEVHQTIRAMEHVFFATKCHILYEREEIDELQEILQNVIDIEDFNDEELGALYGCQSVVWSCLRDFGMHEAADIAKKAVKKHQDCALWHFILAKNLRRQRRSIDLSSKITDIEKEHFEIAYAISKNSVYGVYYLQMRIEDFFFFNKDASYQTKKTINEREVLQLAKEILKKKPTNSKVLLKLALMFLRANVSDEALSAKECLDAVEKIAPNNSTYLHYLGIFYEQRGNYKQALEYFKKAAVDCNNFAAEFSYIQYGWEIGELEPLSYLLKILKKYDQAIKERQIKILLAIAVTYYTIHKDMQNAAEYFFKAIKIDPSSKNFKVSYKFLDFRTKNISHFLNYCFLRVPERYRNPTLHATCRKIEELMELLTLKEINNLTEKIGSSLLK